MTKVLGGLATKIEFNYVDGTKDEEVTASRETTLTKNLKSITVRENNTGGEDYGWVSVSSNGAELIGGLVVGQDAALTLTSPIARPTTTLTVLIWVSRSAKHLLLVKRLNQKALLLMRMNLHSRRRCGTVLSQTLKQL